MKKVAYQSGRTRTRNDTRRAGLATWTLLPETSGLFILSGRNLAGIWPRTGTGGWWRRRQCLLLLKSCFGLPVTNTFEHTPTPPGTHKGYSWMNWCVMGVVKSNFIYTITDRLKHRDASVLRSAWAKNYWLVSKLISVASAMR